MQGEPVSRIDVLCTFRDAEATLRATLDGLSGQAFPGMRAILVDDGSSDDGPAIARALVERDPRFRMVRTTVHGRGHALASALAHSDAPLVAIMDADDVAHPRWLADAANLFARAPDFAVIGFERTFLVDDDRPDWTIPDEAPPAPPRDVTTLLGRANPIGHSGACLSRSAMDAIGGYDLGRSSHFDYDLWIRMAAAGYRLGRSESRRIAKRYHSGQSFAHRKGYLLESFRLQMRAIRCTSRTPFADRARAVTLLARRAGRQALRARGKA